MAKSKSLSKKTIIISVLVIIAIVTAITMVTIFLKDRGQAEATDVDISRMQEQDRQNQGQTTVDSDRNDGSNPIINQEQTESNNNQNDQTQSNEQTTADDESTSSQTVQTGTTATTGAQTGTTTTTQTDNVNTVGTTTIQRVETEVVDVPYQKTWEDNQLEWTPTALASLTVASSRLNTELPDIKVEKTAITESGSTLVSAGEKITYKVKVKNNSKNKLENIDVTDIIPENTTIDENSISHNGKIEENKVIWNISIEAESEIEVSFDVKVNEEIGKLEKVTIKNTAVANGERSNEVANSILETKKTSTVFRNGIELKDTDKEKVVVKKGDIIKYIISVQNKGEVEGTAKVIDEITENLELTENNKYTKQELKDGIEVAVAAGKTENVEIEVEVKDINGSIKNVATVGHSNPTEERDTVNITGVKDVDKKEIKEQEELTYSIKLHNSGNKDGEAIVRDSAPEGTTFVTESVKIGEVEHKEYTEDMLKQGISVQVKAGEDETISFKVKVATIEGTDVKATIKNTALVDEKPTTEAITEAEKEYVTVTVNKIWEDNEIQAKRRPDAIKFEVYKNTETKAVAEYKMDVKSGERTYTFNNLPKYNADGTNINYAVAEKEVISGDLKFYTQSSNASTDALGNKIYNITNKFTKPTDTKSIKVEKVWDDNNNLAGKRPTSVVLQLNGTEDIELTEKDAKLDANKWFLQVTKPVYDENGEEIVYSATEAVEPTFYKKQEVEGSTTVTNTFNAPTSEKTKITVKKVWEDNGNAAGKRPTEIKVTLKATNDSTIAEKELTLTGDMTAQEWTLEEEVQKYNSKADIINYVIEEKETGSIFYTEIKGEADLTVTNKFIVPDTKVPVEVTKIWNDQGDTAGKRPTEIKLQVNGNGTTTEITLDKNDATKLENVWKDKVNLPKYDENGDEIKYTVIEVKEPEFYDKTENGTTVTNTFNAPTSEKTKITAKKVWEDNGNAAGKRPAEIKVILKATNDSTIAEKELTLTGDMTAQEWTLEEEVQKYNSKADIINYVIEEKETGSIFYTEVEGEADLTITNKFVVPNDKADITVKKVWNDNKTTRPNVTFVITGSNSSTNKAEITLTPADAKTDGNIWEKVVSTLPKYDEKGDVITYTVDEKNVPNGYIKSIDEDNRTITNSLPGITVSKSVVEVNGESVEGVSNIGVKLGDVIKYEIKVTNNSTVPLTNVTVTDEIINRVNDTTAPKKQIYLDYDEITGELTGKTNTVATGETILAKETKIYSVYYKVEADDVAIAAQSIKNNAKAIATYKDSNGKDNKVEGEDNATVTIKDAPGLTLVKDKEIWRNGVKQAEGTKVLPGDIIKYTITVTNTGNTVLNNIVVTDTMVGRTGYTITGGEESLNIGTLERTPNNVVIIHSQYVIQETDMAEEERTVTNTAKATSTTAISDPDSETVTTEVYKANITAKKTSKLIKKPGNELENRAEYGDTIKYTITATNTGNKEGTIDVTDTVPSGTELKEKNNNDTNLTETELDVLKTEAGLTKTLNVPANNGTASIYFEVIVKAKPGEVIKNIASVSDGTNPEDEGQPIEKEVEVVKQSEITTITNSNVVIVIDKSGSMKEKRVRYKGQMKTRLEVAKIVVKDFIDTINLPEDGKDGSAISVVTFNGPNNYNEYDVGTTYTNVLKANGKTVSTTASDATELKNAVDNIKATNGTVIAGSLTRAKEQIEEMKKLYPNNNNIVIFIGDGDPDGDNADSFRIPEKAKELKSTGATVYAIGFGQNVNVLRDTVASSKDKYYTTNDNIDLSDVFRKIGEAIKPTEKVPVDSVKGEIELERLDTSHNITLKVKTSKDTEFKTIEKELSYYIDLGQIIERNGKYYLNLKAFNADDEIEIDYFQK